MTDLPAYYPPSPPSVPEDLTEPSASYRRHVNFMAFALLLFFLIYFGLILLLTLGMAYCVIVGGLFNWVAAGAQGLAAAILVKNLFTREKTRKGFDVEIALDDHPKLRTFLECVCADTGAPMPTRILINHMVNAAAGAEVSFISLFVEPSRDLILGLGLINAINLTEFKALLAHEFGHLSQMDMKAAPYVRLAMRVMRNILNGTRLIWLDKVLLTVFIFMVKLERAVWREMEFHADKVAVSVAGSDAIVHLLYKSGWAEVCLQRTVSDLIMASDHNLFTDDVFLHQRRACIYLREKAKDPALGLPPQLPAKRKQTLQIFERDQNRDKTAEMWADHPSNHDRELNAKSDYFRTDFDETSPWTLFNGPDDLTRKVSRQFYRQVFRVKKKDVTFSSGAKVQQFLDEEYAATSFDSDRYGMLYDHRCIEGMDLRALRDHAEAVPNAPESLLASHFSMCTPEVKAFAEIFQRHVNELQMLEAIKEKWFRPKRNEFKMRGRTFHARKAAAILKDAEAEIKADVAWLAEFDRKVFVTYFELAWQLDRKWAEELYQRYRFHYVMQGMWKALQRHKPAMAFMLNLLTAPNEDGEAGMLDQKTLYIMIAVFRQAYDAMRSVLTEAELIKFPDLTNLPAGQPVRPFLLRGAIVDQPAPLDGIRPKKLENFAGQFEAVLQRLDRLHFKSLGTILALQETIGQTAARKWPLPTAKLAYDPLPGR